MTRKSFLLCCATGALILGMTTHLGAQSINYGKASIKFYDQVQSLFYLPQKNYYKEHASPAKDDRAVSYLWSLCALVQADNEMERLLPKRDFRKTVLSVIEKYDDLDPPAPGYDSYPSEFKKEDRYYDDNQWIGLAAMDAYFRTKKKADLQMGEKIYTFMMTGFDTVSGGGLYWREGDKNTKNTCSNGPGIILALQLYKATKQRPYLDTALLLYNWVNRYLKSPENLYYDNLNVGTGRIAQHYYSYNTGTMLQANVYLFELTKDKKYLNEAVSIANASLDYFYGKGKFIDDYWFNAVLLRAYEQLYTFHKDKKYLLAFKRCLDYALENDLNQNGLIGKDKPENLVGQGGMLEILSRFAWLQQNKVL